MTHGAIYSELEDVFRAVFNDPSLRIGPQTSALDIPGWDSVQMINIILSVEERLRIRLPGTETDALQTVGELVNLIAKRLGQKELVERS